MTKQVAKLPECSQHGYMQLQHPGTPEQSFCGTWYRCNRCTNTVLLPSPALAAQYDVVAAYQKVPGL